MFRVLQILSILFVFTVSKPVDIPDLVKELVTGTSKECLAETYNLASRFKDIQEKYNSKFGNVDVLYNKELMTSLVRDLETISSSIKTSNCSKISFVKYFVDGAVFIGNNIYGEAFSCLANEDLESKFFTCARGMVPDDSANDILEYLKPVSFCVAQKLKCSQEDRNSFISAVYAGVDLFETFYNGKEILKQIEEKQLKLEFLPDKYNHVMN